MTYLNEWNKTRLTSFERDGNPGINRINDCLECGNHIYHELDGGTLKTLRIAEKLRKPVRAKKQEATETVIVLVCEMPPSNVTNGPADSCATITARQLGRLTWQGRVVCFIGAPLHLLFSAVLARGVCAVIPRFFYAAGIAAAKMLLFFQESAAMDILNTMGEQSHPTQHHPTRRRRCRHPRSGQRRSGLRRSRSRAHARTGGDCG